MLLRTTRRLSTSFSRTAALEGKLARREASAAIQGKEDAPKLSRADAIEGRLARREAAALLQGAAEASSLTRAEMIEGRLARREAAALVQSLEASQELIVVDLTGTGAQDAAIGQVAWDKLGN